MYLLLDLYAETFYGRQCKVNIQCISIALCVHFLKLTHFNYRRGCYVYVTFNTPNNVCTETYTYRWRPCLVLSMYTLLQASKVNILSQFITFLIQCIWNTVKRVSVIFTLHQISITVCVQEVIGVIISHLYYSVCKEAYFITVTVRVWRRSTED